MEQKKQSHQSTRQAKITLLEKLKQYIQKKELFSEGATIIVGLSGGPDSVFILHLLVELKKDKRIKEVVAAHLDHEWRPESAKDVLFCKAMAEQLGVPFESAKLSELPISLRWNGSKEELGRKARRFYLESVRKKYGADAIALGHHAQDQEETFFLRLIRGASLTGLCGMKEKDGWYVRPLLHTDKQSVLGYLNEHHVNYLEDETNQSEHFLRNRIRTNVLPSLKKTDSRFQQTFAKTLSKLQSLEQYLDQQANVLVKKVCSKGNVLDIRLFKKSHPAMQEKLLIKWLIASNASFSPSDALLQEVMRFFATEHGGSHTVYPDWKIIKKQHKAWIEK